MVPFNITQAPEFAVTETMNGQEVSDITLRSLANQHPHLFPIIRL